MLDVPQLALDVSSNVVGIALPGAVWAVLFFLAWEHRPFAESLGFGRQAFWLLLPGALLASYAILPLAPVSVDWVAVDLGGALFPLLVGAFAIERYAPPLAPALARYLLPMGIASAALLFLVWPSNGAAWTRAGSALGIGANGAESLAVAGVAAVASVVVLAWPSDPASASARRTGFLFVLTMAVLTLTFVGSAAIPGVGIVEGFPYFLVAPLSAGVVAAVVAGRIFPREEAFAIPVAFFATAVGVLLGADLLRQPPLYGSGGPGLYAIGGAGVLDLVYLSGLLALAAALAAHLALGRRWSPVGRSVPSPPPTPIDQLRTAYRAGVAGQLRPSLDASVASARSSAAQARRLLGLGPAPEGRPWDGLPVPGWVVSDHANLEGAARSGTADLREGYRAWLTARWLVFVGRELSSRRLASVGSRLAAFGIDLAIVSAPAMLLFAVIVGATSGDLYDVASSVAFTTAIVGFVSVALLYFVLAETLVGTTVGKAIVGIEVRDRHLGTPTALASLVRNVPLGPVLTVVGFGGALAIAVALKGTGVGGTALFGGAVPSGLVTDIDLVVFVAIGVILFGSVGVLAMALTSERQRIGDLWAGTWVVREADDPPAASAPADASPRPASEADRSG